MPEGFSWSELGIDPARVEVIDDSRLTSDGEFVLYWCQINHRATHNHALDAAIRIANHLSLPVVCYQALRPDYPYASDRFHAFIIDGHADMRDGLEERGIAHWLELPRNKREHVKRISQLAKRAAAIVTDLFPTYIVPGHIRGAKRKISVPFIAVDASCVIPMKRIPDAQIGARTLRPKIHKLWPEYSAHFRDASLKNPSFGKRSLTPDFDIEKHPEKRREALGEFAIDHHVVPVNGVTGGRRAALKRLRYFFQKNLETFGEGRNDPADDRSARISPYLHFGHVSSLEAVHGAIQAFDEKHPGVATFFEQVVVRRELGFNWCWHTPQAAQLAFGSLPTWAQKTLNDHRKDKRPEPYTDDELEFSRTDDEVWNAAQRELTQRGVIHNYLRMLWGKKILEWSKSPEEAIERIARFNDKYALDGRDPVSMGNFMWILGLHDRPFQERAIIGKVRPMSSMRTAQKFDLTAYLRRFR